MPSSFFISSPSIYTFLSNNAECQFNSQFEIQLHNEQQVKERFDYSLVMVDWVSLKKRDYELSYKLASLLSYEGITRKLVQIFTITGTAFFWYAILILGYFLSPDLRVEIYTLFFMTSVMLIPVTLIKRTLKRPRPDFKDTRFGSVAFDHWSFPSGHATRGTYIPIIMVLIFPQWSWFWIVWGLLILLSRLLLGVHYITDIIAGFILGLSSMFLFLLIDWLPTAPYASNFQ